MSSGGIEIPISFEAEGSQVTLERLAAAVKDLERATDDLAKKAKKTSTGLQDIAKSAGDVGRSLLPASVAVSALGFAVIKLAVDFESSFAGVRKTVDATEEEFAALAEGFRDLSKEIPVSVNELNELGEAAGQLGIEQDNILGFTRVMADLGATTNLASTEAATALARLANITGLPQDEFDRLGSTIVDLGNTLATTESEIVNFGLRIAGAGELAGLSEPEILGIGAAMSSIGVEAEAGGTSVQKVLNQITAAVATNNEELEVFAETAGLSVEAFKQAFEEDAAGAFTAFVEGLGEQGTDAFSTMEELGLESERVIRAFLGLAGAGDLLSRSLETAGSAFEENTALAAEAAQRYETFASQSVILFNRLKDVGVTIGTALLPALVDAVDALQPLLGVLETASQLFAELPGPVRTAVLGLGALAAVAAPVLIAVGSIASSLSALGIAAGAASAAFLPLTAAVAAIAGGAALGLWLRENSTLFRGLTDAIGDMVTSASGLDLLFAQWEKGVEVTDNFTDAENASLAAHIARQAALQRETLLMGEFTGPVQEATDALEGEAAAVRDAAAALSDEMIVAAVRATEEAANLEAATELMGVKITNAAQAERILEVASNNAASAIKQQAEQQERLAEQELEKHIDAVAAAARGLTGALEPEAFSVLSDAVAGIGDASEVAVDKLEALAIQLIEAKGRGEDLPPIADDIVERWITLNNAEAAIVATNVALLEQVRLSALLGPSVETVTKSFEDLVDAAVIRGGDEGIAGLDDSELIALGQGLQKNIEEAENLGEEVEGLGEIGLTVFGELVARGIDVGVVMGEVTDDTETATESTFSWADSLQVAADAATALGLDTENAFLQAANGILAAAAAGEQAAKAFDAAGGGIKGVAAAAPGALSTIGQIQEGATSAAGGAASGAAAGAAFGSAFGPQGAAIGAIAGGLIGFFSGRKFAKIAAEAGEALGTELSDELVRKIQDDADRIGASIEDAALLSIAEAFEESGEAAATFADETITLLGKVADGTIPLEEGLAEVGQVFGSIAEEALNAGRVGDAAMRGIIRTSRELGLEVPEISRFVDEQLTLATKGLAKFVDSLAFVSEEAFATLGADAAVIFGATFDALVSERGLVGAVDALEGSFGALRETLVESLGEETAAQLVAPFAAAFTLLQDENLRPLVEGIDGLSQAFSGLANADFLNIDQFRAAERAAGTLFDELVAGGADTGTALLAIAPSIQSAISAAEQFGIPLSEDTQRLKDLAEQNGITFKTDPQQQMLDVLTAIAKVLGADIPASAQAATDAITGLGDGIVQTGDQIDAAGFGPDDRFEGGRFAAGENAETGGVPTFPGAPGAPTPAASAAAVAQTTINLELTIDENPLAAAETAEALRRQTVNEVANALEDRVASLVAAASPTTGGT